MKILFGIHQFFPKYYTGTERYVLSLAKQIQKMGHYVKILTYAYNDRDGFHSGDSLNILRKEYFYEGISVIAIRHKVQHEDISFMLDLMDTDIYNETRKIFEESNFDIYHCAHPLRIAPSIKAANDSGMKIALMLTDYWLMCSLGIMLRSDNSICDDPNQGRNCLKYCFPSITENRIKERIADSRRLLECCDVLLSPSKFLIKLFNSTGFLSENRFTLSRHGYDYATKPNFFYKEMDDTITFGYIGTVQYHKGVHIMVEGFKNTRHQNIRLQVWGGSFHEVEYHERVGKLAEGDPRIEFKGTYDYSDIESILKNIDVIIVPSIWYENAPLTIMTSLAYGIPVVTSDIGGMKEAIQDRKNGMTFKVGDSTDLSNKIDLIALNPGIISEFRKNIQYPIRLEEEAFNTELVYKRLMGKT